MPRPQSITAAEKFSTAYFEWKEAGHGPQTRDEALRIIRERLHFYQVSLDLAKLRRGLGKSYAMGDVEAGVNSNLMFIVWDLTANAGRALNYDQTSNYVQGLLDQAGAVLSSVRHKVPTQNGIISIPQSVVIPRDGLGRQRIQKMTSVDIAEFIEAELNQLRIRVHRWKNMGASLAQVKRALRRFEAAALEAYENEAVAAEDAAKDAA